MPPNLALTLGTIFVLLAFRFEPRDTRISRALWIPLIWMLILGSRLPSQWLGINFGTVGQTYQDGNAFDRLIYVLLILAALRVVWSRSLSVGKILKENLALVLFVTLGLLSVSWSDFPFISFKRWIRDFGGYLMILVVLSETSPLEAIEKLLRRVAYILIPFSVVLVKYFPHLSRGYNPWTGGGEYHGVATSKNLLAMVCLLSILVFLFDVMKRWPTRGDRVTQRYLIYDATFLGMSLWLLNLANSATSSACLAIGVLILVIGRTSLIRRSPGILKVLLPATLAFCLVADWIFDLQATVTRALGRDETFTTRTFLWRYLDTMDVNWLLGTGYESFWVGPRLQQIWSVPGFAYLPNQAHNGYREVYLNLGVLGLLALILFLLASYRKISRQLSQSPHLAVFGMSLWTIMLLYNVTEAAFKAHLLWLTFLIITIGVGVTSEANAPLRNAAPESKTRKFNGTGIRRPRELRPVRTTIRT